MNIRPPPTQHPRPPTHQNTQRAWLLDLAQGAPAGRLLVFDPATRETTVLAKGFYYANGVALAPDESYLLLVETNRIRVNKHWLKGPKVGGGMMGRGQKRAAACVGLACWGAG